MKSMKKDSVVLQCKPLTPSRNAQRINPRGLVYHVLRMNSKSHLEWCFTLKICSKTLVIWIMFRATTISKLSYWSRNKFSLIQIQNIMFSICFWHCYLINYITYKGYLLNTKQLRLEWNKRFKNLIINFPKIMPFIKKYLKLFDFTIIYCVSMHSL